MCLVIVTTVKVTMTNHSDVEELPLEDFLGEGEDIENLLVEKQNTRLLDPFLVIVTLMEITMLSHREVEEPFFLKTSLMQIWRILKKLPEKQISIDSILLILNCNSLFDTVQPVPSSGNAISFLTIERSSKLRKHCP